MRDIFLVARFEILRAVRTWRAFALVVLVSVAMGGGAYLFTRFVGLLENQTAARLGVAPTRVPGAMLHELLTSDTYRDILNQIFDDAVTVEWVLGLHPSALFFFGLVTLVIPFFAATASAESLAIDVQSRAIRYEALRTSRLDLVLGRFVGQTVLMTAALVVAAGMALVVTLGSMVVVDPLGLTRDIAMFSIRAWAFGLPFVGVGLAASQVTASPAWARVLAIGLTLASWVAVTAGPWLADQVGLVDVLEALSFLVPQTHLAVMWRPGLDWTGGVLMEVVLAMVATVAAFPLFARRNL